jgi:hypothetical protein
VQRISGDAASGWRPGGNQSAALDSRLPAAARPAAGGRQQILVTRERRSDGSLIVQIVELAEHRLGRNMPLKLLFSHSPCFVFPTVAISLRGFVFPTVASLHRGSESGLVKFPCYPNAKRAPSRPSSTPRSSHVSVCKPSLQSYNVLCLVWLHHGWTLFQSSARSSRGIVRLPASKWWRAAVAMAPSGNNLVPPGFVVRRAP